MYQWLVSNSSTDNSIIPLTLQRWRLECGEIAVVLHLIHSYQPKSSVVVAIYHSVTSLQP